MAKKKTTTGVIDINSMYKAGLSTGLVPTKETGSDVPNVVKQIGSFAMKQYFNALSYKRLATQQERKLFTDYTSKAHIQDNLATKEAVELLYEEYKGLNNFLNKPWNMLNPWSEKYKAAEERKTVIQESLSMMDNFTETYQQQVSNDAQILTDKAVDKDGLKISFNGGANSTQVLMSSARGSGALTDAMTFLPDESGHMIPMVRIDLLDWDEDDLIGSKDLVIKYIDLTFVLNEKSQSFSLHSKIVPL